MKIKALVPAAAMLTLLRLADPVLAQLKAPSVPNPDPAVQAAVTAESAAIRRLLEVATDRGAATAARVKAISDLGGLYFDHFLANAEALTKDANGEVARTSVLLIGGQISMLHASHGGGHGAHAAGAPDYDAYVVDESIRLLRQATDHPDASVRHAAFGILASRGDLQALARVQGKIEAGQLGAAEGVRYLSLAPLDVAAPYIAPYLASTDGAVRRAAVAPLSYHPRYTAAVRSLVVGPGRDEAVIRAALPGLSVTDREFARYGSAIAQDKALSQETREVALESAVRFVLKPGTPSGAAQDLEAALGDAAEELKSDRARAAMRDLKARQPIE